MFSLSSKMFECLIKLFLANFYEDAKNIELSASIYFFFHTSTLKKAHTFVLEKLNDKSHFLKLVFQNNSDKSM